MKLQVEVLLFGIHMYKSGLFVYIENSVNFTVEYVKCVYWIPVSGSLIAVIVGVKRQPWITCIYF